MTKIEIDGFSLQYKPYIKHVGSDTYWYTAFYSCTEAIIVRKRSWIFGKITEVQEPKLLFIVKMDCTDSNIGKDWWQLEIRNKLQIVKRAEELIRGELI